MKCNRMEKWAYAKPLVEIFSAEPASLVCGSDPVYVLPDTDESEGNWDGDKEETVGKIILGDEVVPPAKKGTLWEE